LKTNQKKLDQKQNIIEESKQEIQQLEDSIKELAEPIELRKILLPEQVYIQMNNGKFLTVEKNLISGYSLSIGSTESNLNQHCVFLVENLDENKATLKVADKQHNL